MKNNKGIAPLPIFIIQLLFVGTAVACVWHIPAWEKAKSEGSDARAIYQAQKMWPQQVFDKLPGNHTVTAITYVKGNGGNFSGGIDAAH